MAVVFVVFVFNNNITKQNYHTGNRNKVTTLCQTMTGRLLTRKQVRIINLPMPMVLHGGHNTIVCSRAQYNFVFVCLVGD